VFLPSATQTVRTFWHYLDRPYPSQGSPLWYDALTSLRRILIGFAVGVVAGVTLGAAMSACCVVRHLIDPVIEVLRPLPPLAFIPLFIIAVIALALDACLRGLLLLADPSRRG
jgi:taurine transport system permease protein